MQSCIYISETKTSTKGQNVSINVVYQNLFDKFMQSGNRTSYILRRIFSIHFLMFWWWRAYTCFLSLHGSPSFRNNMKTTAVCCIVFSFIYDSLKHNQSIWKDMKEMIKAVVYVSFICLYIWYWLVIIHCYFSSRESIRQIQLIYFISKVQNQYSKL